MGGAVFCMTEFESFRLPPADYFSGFAGPFDAFAELYLALAPRAKCHADVCVALVISF